MPTSTMAHNHSDAHNTSKDYRLLLTRIEQAPLDAAGLEFVGQALDSANFLHQLGADELVRVAAIAQQHGLVQKSLELYDLCNTLFPDHVRAWEDHLATLAMLNDRERLIRTKARAKQALPGEAVDRLTGSLASVLPREPEPDETGSITEPFENLRHQEENIALYMRLFRGRSDAFARQWADRNQERQGYVPVKRPMLPADILDHLSGKRTYGLYLLDHDAEVYTGVVDMDLVKSLRDRNEFKKQAREIRREAMYLHDRIENLAAEAGLCCIAEVSGGKGYHFWFPVDSPVPAGAMRRALQQVIGTLDRDVRSFTLEIFPKQDRLTGKGFGNLVKLPLGIHRGTGKPSWFVRAPDRTEQRQFEYLRSLKPAPAENILRLAKMHREKPVIVHPRHAAWAKEFPELALLDARCAMLARIMAVLRSDKVLTLREEKILLGTLGHLPRGRILLHHLFSRLPEYNRPLLDYKISRVRGTVLGCKRIHSLMEQGTGSLPCEFDGKGYAHPLRHLPGAGAGDEPRSERIENIRDALDNLKAAIRQVERFMGK
ncbi:CRISPR-associated primase-polymerase type A1 [Desulfolithobacter sp.]